LRNKRIEKQSNGAKNSLISQFVVLNIGSVAFITAFIEYNELRNKRIKNPKTATKIRLFLNSLYSINRLINKRNEVTK